jgi:hypothetical protein
VPKLVRMELEVLKRIILLILAIRLDHFPQIDQGTIRLADQLKRLYESSQRFREVSAR